MCFRSYWPMWSRKQRIPRLYLYLSLRRLFKSVTWYLHCCKGFSEFLTHTMMTSSNETIFRVTGPLWTTGEFPSQRPVRRSFDVFFDLICAWTNGWIIVHCNRDHFVCAPSLNKRLINNRYAGDLRPHHPHYDITAMQIILMVTDGMTYSLPIFIIGVQRWWCQLTSHDFKNVTIKKPESMRVDINILRSRQMATISQTFSNALSLLKMFEFGLKFFSILSLRAQLTINHHWFR